MAAAPAQDFARELVAAAKVLSAAGCLPATDGNLSARSDRRTVLLTTAGAEKRNLREDSLVEVSLDDAAPARASSEWPMHRALYSSRPDLGAVLHVHAPYLTTFAAARQIPRIDLLAEARVTLAGIALVPFCRPGSAELGEAILEASRDAGIYLLANHGAVAVGASVREALHRLERAEFLARVDWQCRLLGGGVPLDPAEIEQLLAPLPASALTRE